MLDRALVPATIPEPDDDGWPAQAGWYFDPSVSARRWWDGDQWTDLVETRVPVSNAGRHSNEPGRHGVGVRTGSPFGRHGALPDPQLVTGRRVLVAAGAVAAAALVFGVVVPALRTSPQPQAAPGGSASATPPASSTPPTTPSTRPSGLAATPPASRPATASPTPQGGTGGTSSDASLLVDTSGSGSSVLPEFATLGAWQLQYTFDCGAVGGSHPFRITSPDGAVVDVKGSSGAAAVDRTSQGIVKLTVTTPCAWTVQVFGPAATP